MIAQTADLIAEDIGEVLHNTAERNHEDVNGALARIFGALDNALDEGATTGMLRTILRGVGSRVGWTE